MKGFPIIVLTSIIMAAFVLAPVIATAEYGQSATSTPPLSQPLVREGTLAVKLADTFKLGPAANETEAESSLSAAGIAPKNGWIADYPVTPDVAVEIQTSLTDAATGGRIPETKDSAVKAFQDVMASYNLSVAAGISNPVANEASPPAYPESDVANDYYYDEGPPVVTYYAPPPDYSYLYSWVPYPFWWWDFWFPGFFVLADFDIGFHGHHGHHGHDGHGHGGGGFVSNHFRDPSTGRMSRIDPATRAHGGALSATGSTAGWTSPSARSSAQAIVSRSQSFAGSRVGGATVSPSSHVMSAQTSRNQASVSNSWRGSVAGAPAARTTNFSSRRSVNQSAYRGQASGQYRNYTQPAYRTYGNYSSSAAARSFSAPSGGWRSFSAPSAGGRSGGGSCSGMRSSFGGGGFRGGGFRR